MSVRPPPVPRHLPPALLLLAAILAALLAMPGCSGCWSKTPTADAKKKKEDELAELEKKRKKKLEKPKDDFEPLAVRMLPSNDPSPTDTRIGIRVKPGHWTAVREAAKANNFDFQGELATYAQSQNQPLEVEDTTSRLTAWCPAVLAKGRSKWIESLFYIPRRKPELSRNYQLRSELRAARGGRTEATTISGGNALKDYEHLIVVLAGGSVTPAAYSHFDRLLSVKLPPNEFEQDDRHFYYVVRPAAERSVPLPSHSLAWTTIAYVFWDDLNPAVLTQQQQRALLDWLHFGGQLIISGPNSLDKLKGSFLSPYLPAEATQTVKLEQVAFDELNATFSLARAQAKDVALRKIVILPERPMLGVELKKHEEAREVAGTGGLVVERRLGGGRIVVTGFPLTDVRIKQWKNLDGFFNAVLLRRPGREFGFDSLNQLDVKWTTPELNAFLLEPRVSSTVRYFTRDIGSLDTVQRRPSPPARRDVRAYDPFDPDGLARVRPDTFQTDPDIDDWHLCGYHSNSLSGVAGWNDNGAASEAARAALTEAAGIQIPRAEFVVQVLAVYLLVLVPINWLLFWLIGRVEWAWIAAPLISIVGAGAVIRLAQLDIGFARSRTEVGVLEIQGGYERAHLTRYTALYTSLSSNYTLAFADHSSLALPFSAGPRNESFLTIANYTDVAFRRDKETSLAGVQVSSNSTGMVHSEQMFDVGGKLSLVGDDASGYTLKNSTLVEIRDAGILRRTPDGRQVLTAYLARLAPQSSAPLRFSPADFGEADAAGRAALWLPEWNRSAALALDGALSGDERAGIRLTRLARLATQKLRLLPGDVRLVGWTDQRLGGMQIRPEAPQNATYTLVLAHVLRGPLPPVQPDKNVADDFYKPGGDDPDSTDPDPELERTASSNDQ